ncbi:MAG: DegV family protein [Lachnospiraceae bacterium]|nr:DegV family protein [Lachnospiraceae bacterium]
MGDYVISCCSTADITKEHFIKRDIKYICFHFEIDGKQYMDDLGESMDFHEFYQRMATGSMTRTSQINVDEFVNYFEPFLKEGKDIIHLSLSSGISGVVNSAQIARQDLQEKYPDRKIYVIDSLAASAGYGLLMDILADMRDEGKTIDELKDYVEENKLYIHHWFFTTDLTYLVRGGRVTKTAGFVGNLLNICPLLNVNNEGKLIPREKIRTAKKVIREAVEKMKEHALNGTDYDGKCYISHSDCMDLVDQEVALIEEAFPKLKGKIEVTYIGTTIGSHTGPGTVALFFVGKDERTE